MGRTASRLQIAAIVIVSTVALVGLAGYFAVPVAARWGIETVGSREIGRTVRVDSISANPYTMQGSYRPAGVTPGYHRPSRSRS